MTSSRGNISGNTARELLKNCASNLDEASRLLLNEEDAQSDGRTTTVKVRMRFNMTFNMIFDMV